MASTIPYSNFIGSHDPYPVLENTPGRIQQIREMLPDGTLSQPPQPGKWSFHEIVAHLADCELMFQSRLRLILFEDQPRLPAFDQAKWTSGWAREQEPFEDTFARFAVLRKSTLRLLRNTPDADLRRTGIHSERGIVEAFEFPILMAGHDLNHLAQLEAIRERFSKA
jgi:hypothetical protein